MRWKVEVVGVGGNDRLLRDVLRQLSIEVVGDSPECFLASAGFEACLSAQEVHTVALRLQTVIEGVGKHDAELGRELDLKVGRVWEQRDDGTWIQHHRLIVESAAIVLNGVQATMTLGILSAVSDEERKRIEEERREQAYQELRRKGVSRVIPAFHDDRALQVQEFLAGRLTPLSMGHIADLINDIRPALSEFASDDQLTRFSRSINHPLVFGEEARHIVSKQEPPPNPMTLDEARDFIRSLASRWLERKAGL